MFARYRHFRLCILRGAVRCAGACAFTVAGAALVMRNPMHGPSRISTIVFGMALRRAVVQRVSEGHSQSVA